MKVPVYGIFLMVITLLTPATWLYTFKQLSTCTWAGPITCVWIEHVWLYDCNIDSPQPSITVYQYINAPPQLYIITYK